LAYSANHSSLPMQICWESFGRANGVPSFENSGTRSPNIAMT
jgi:hypothetical protein